MLYDITRRYPRAYVHRHKLHARHAPFKQIGQSEVTMLVGQIDTLLQSTAMDQSSTIIINNPSGANKLEFKLKKIYSKPPHLVADNYFSSDMLMDWLGKKGYGMTATCARDRIPQALKPYTHHAKVPDASHPRCKAMRFENPVVAIQQRPSVVDGDLPYTKTFVSFQSTGGTNIIGVNNLPSVHLYVGKKDRGIQKKGTKRVWGIEQNEARETYLNHYYGLDNADHMVKNTGNRYITWKYWHAPYLHGQSLGIIAAYDMYLECCEGEIDQSWKVDIKKRMTFSQFRMRLSEQMLTYDPGMKLYPGDGTFRTVTQKHKSRRSSEDDDKRYSNDGVTMENYKLALESGRLCSTITELQEHFGSVDKTTNLSKCEVCGDKTIWKCNKCGKSLCTTKKRNWNGGKCIFTYHSHEFFGLSRSDCKDLFGNKIETWRPLTEAAMAKNARKIRRWMNEMEMEKRAAES